MKSSTEIQPYSGAQSPARSKGSDHSDDEGIAKRQCPEPIRAVALGGLKGLATHPVEGIPVAAEIATMIRAKIMDKTGLI